MHPARHGPERARARERELERLAVGVLWTLWCWRVELALVAVLVVAQRVIAALGGDPVGAVVVAVIAIAVLAVPAGQRKVRARLQSARARRRWARAEVESGAARGPFRVSRVLGVTFVASGI